MKKQKKLTVKLLCTIVVLATVLTTMPLMTFANDVPQSITNEDEFLSMDPTGNYKLENDITVTSPYASDFVGTFDGQGHTVTLNISEKSQYLGMFKRLAGNSTVKNVVTAGYVTADGKEYAGGIAGYADTSTGDIVIADCKNTADISGKKKVGGILGAVTSSGNQLTISGCANEGTVTGTGNQVGGIVGIMEESHVITNCSNTGNVSGEKAVAGIAGRASNGVTISNCYTAGNVAGSKEAYAIVGDASSGTATTVTNSYAIEGTGKALVCEKVEIDEASAYKSADNMKTAEFAATLGEAYAYSEGNYPIHSWEVPTVTSIELGGTYKTEYVVGEELDTTGLEVTVYYSNDTSETITEGFDVEGFDSSAPVEEQVLTVTYGEASAEYTISVEEAVYDITFNVIRPEGIDADYTVEVKSGDEVVEPSEDGIYELAAGEYTYTVTCEGCEEKTGEFTVEDADKAVYVKLEKSEEPSNKGDDDQNETTTQNTDNNKKNNNNSNKNNDKNSNKTSNDNKTPKTADENNMSLWIILLAAAVGVGTTAAVSRRKKKEQ